MTNENTVHGTHFTCVHAGPKEGWTQFRLEPPDVPLPAKGKKFLRSETIDVEEGSVLRISPAGARAWRNNSDAPLYFLCIQYRADIVVQGGTLDGLRVEGEPTWVN